MRTRVIIVVVFLATVAMILGSNAPAKILAMAKMGPSNWQRSAEFRKEAEQAKVGDFVIMPYGETVDEKLCLIVDDPPAGAAHPWEICVRPLYVVKQNGSMVIVLDRYGQYLAETNQQYPEIVRRDNRLRWQELRKEFPETSQLASAN